MARPRKPATTRKPGSVPSRPPKTPPKKKPLGPTAAAGKARYQASYGGDSPYGPPGVEGVQDYVKGLSPKERRAFFREIERNTQNSLLNGTWSGGLSTAEATTGVLLGELPMAARLAYAKAGGHGRSSGGAGGGEAGDGSFTTGVSGATGYFIKEKGAKGPKGGESTAGKAGRTKGRGKGGGGRSKLRGQTMTKKGMVAKKKLASLRGKSGVRRPYGVGRGRHISKSGSIVKNQGRRTKKK